MFDINNILYVHLAERKDDLFLDEVCFINKGGTYVMEPLMVCDITDHHLFPRAESTLQSNSWFYVPACAGKKWGHYFGGTLLSS